MSETAELMSGDEAIALGALHAGVRLGTGYPGTPSTEILETFDRLGGQAQWSPNEKVALEVALGAAFAGARTLCTMKHVGLNVAADPLFTAAYTDLVGGLVVVTADDPGMASSQNEQDNRHYARAAGLPMLEPLRLPAGLRLRPARLRALRALAHPRPAARHHPRVPRQNRSCTRARATPRGPPRPSRAICRRGS